MSYRLLCDLCSKDYTLLTAMLGDDITAEFQSMGTILSGSNEARLDKSAACLTTRILSVPEY